MRAALPALVLATAIASAACAGERAAAGTAAAPPGPAEVPNPFPVVERPWGRLPDGLAWGQVSAVDLDLDRRHLWVADRCGAVNCLGSDRDVVFRLDPAGRVVARFGAGMFVRPHGVHVDREGNVWVTDHQSARAEQLARDPGAAGRGQRVVKFSPAGDVLLVLGTPGEPGDPPGRLDNPTDVIVAPNGDVFVAEGHSNERPPGRISKFSADGTFLKSWGRFGSGPGEFRTPHGLAFDSRGRLYVADRGNSRIQVFDQEGNLLEELRQFGRPNDVFIDGDDVLYVPDSESDGETNPGFARGIYVGSARTGELLGFVPGHPREGDPAGTMGEGVVVDAAGTLYVAEVSLRGLTRMSPR